MTSRATVIAIGMRGDIEPLVSIAGGLAAAGLRVRCATHPDFADAVRSRGLEYAEVRGRADTFFGGAAGAAFRNALGDGRTFRRLFEDYLSLFYRHVLEDAWSAVQGADLVVCWPWLRLGASLREALRVPVVVASSYPPMHVPTAAFANPYQRHASVPDSPHGRRRSWRVALPAYAAGDAELDRWRRETLGLGSRGWRSELRLARALPHVLAFSTHVLPRPDDWPPATHVTGYAFADADVDYPPPPVLSAFLASGPPPVVIGFSSQVGRDRRAAAMVVEEAVSMVGVRAVVATGFGGVAGIAPSDRICVAPSVPYDWLFRHACAVVHHGGSGSVGMALRHGLPNVAVPFGYDQGLWAARVHAIGAGPAPIDHRDLSSERLARAIGTMMEDRGMRERAAHLQALIGAEDGVAAATSVILDVCAEHRSRS